MEAQTDRDPLEDRRDLWQSATEAELHSAALKALRTGTINAHFLVFLRRERPDCLRAVARELVAEGVGLHPNLISLLEQR